MANRKPSEEVAVPEITGESYNPDIAEEINSFDDLVNTFGGLGQGIVDIGEVIGGYIPLSDKDKDKLLDTPFVILGWKEYLGDTGPFKAMFVMTKDNEKYVVNDGSSGIFQQLNDFEGRGVPLPIYVPNGLRKSEYPVLNGAPMTPEQKKEGLKHDSIGTTYYIDTTRSVNRR